jgi:hypothetical protein
MALTIEDPEVEALAAGLAQRTGGTVAEALRDALRARLAEFPEYEAEKDAFLVRIRARAAAFRAAYGPIEVTNADFDALWGEAT